MTSLCNIQDWAPDAIGYLRTRFDYIDIPLFVIDAELYGAAYVLSYGANEIAKHFGIRAEVTFRCTDETFHPLFEARPDSPGQTHAVKQALEAMVQMSVFFAEEPKTAGRAILDHVFHPAPGTSMPAAHDEVFAKLKKIQEGRPIPKPGTAESTRYLIGLMRSLKSGSLADEEYDFFERIYGDTADAYSRPLPEHAIDEMPTDDLVDEGARDRAMQKLRDLVKGERQ